MTVRGCDQLALVLSAARGEIAALPPNCLVRSTVGPVTDDLRDCRPHHGFGTEGGELQVEATNTRQLFDQLKGRAFALVEKAITMPRFK